jgi:hypothetical protein
MAKINREELHKLLCDKPIEPQYGVARMRTYPLQDWLNDSHKQFFADFAGFAEALNKQWLPNQRTGWEGMPWRLQEHEDTDISTAATEGPFFGRRYGVTYNQLSLGQLDVYPDLDYTSAEPAVTVDIELEHTRLLSFYDTYGFLIWIAGRLTSNTKEEAAEARAAIERSLLGAVWQLPLRIEESKWPLTSKIYRPDMDDDDGFYAGPSIDIQIYGTANLFWLAKRNS